MVFESIVADLLNRFLGDYVENLDRSQLKIGIWGGDVVLNDLILKQSALNELDLPVKTICGRLGKLTLKIPWKNLYTAPVEASIERLFLLVVPSTDVKYDAVKEEKYKQEVKQKELERIDKAKQAEKGDADKKNDTFVEKLATQIIRNVQISIKDIHIRYEDKTTCPSQPFSVGFTLHLLSVQTTDDQWKPYVVKETEPKFHKFVDLVGLAVYWNCNQNSFMNYDDKQKMELFQKGIASRNYQPNDYTYLLGPIDSSAQLTLAPRPEIMVPKYSEPKVHVKVEMQELSLGIGKYQYQDVVQLLDAFERLENAARYRKYRPNVEGYRGHYREWWHFAYECILTEEIRRKKQNWDWNHIRKHRALCRKYAEAYGTILMNPSAKLKPVIEECEALLDVFNITLVRQKTELEVGRKMIKKEEEKASQGWFSGWWGGSKKESNVEATNTNDIVSQFEMAMTDEEKKKLYRAIGYGEGTVAPEQYPSTFIEYSLSFLLKRLVVEVWEGDLQSGSTIKAKTILNARMSGVKFDIEKRPISAVRVISGISRLEVSGSPAKDGSLPLLVAPPGQIKASKSSDDDELLHIFFETDPIDGKCDRRLRIRAAPLHIIYDAVTINSVIAVFRPPRGVQLERLRAAAISGMEEIKERSSTGLQHAIDNHKNLDLEINIMSSRILIPENGTLTKDASFLIINLGGLMMKSVAQEKGMVSIKKLARSGATEEDVLKEMFLYSYDQFIIDFRDMQVLMVCNHEDWESVVGVNSKLHLLHPLALEIRIFICLITDDPRLPKVKVDVHLPPVHVHFSDQRLLSLANLFQNFPMPGEDEEDILPPLDTCSIASSTYNISELGAIGARMAPPSSLKSSSAAPLVQSTLTELTFHANEFVMSVGREIDPEDMPLVEFRLDTLEAQIKQRTFDLTISLHIGSVLLKQGVLGCKEPIHMLSVAHAPVDETDGEVQEKQHLLSILFTQVSDKSPDFQTEWKSVERSLSIHLTGVILAVHAEAVMALKEFVENLLQNISQDSSSKRKVNELALPGPSRAASTLNINMPSGKITFLIY
ncbi:hypothetical protein J437_LFUL009199 [Ladona fulva]|uniref:Chorein N-terminal domain-containing protein n=1 Tax=Ladona fulva TaxID=123851 RepID=A0A8K0K810_LADFU|nr:hypothetical protein J437_LFUL009199 [Ladona fulva]